MTNNERLYRYSCNVNGTHHTGITWNTSKQNVIKDVRGNYINPTRIIVVWLKPNTIEYEMALIK